MIGRLLGIDHGIKRIGVAVSDGMGIVAREHSIIERSSRAADFDRLNALAREENIVAFVVGIPHHESPEETHQQADTVRLWVERFSQTTTLPIIEWDEQLTSEDAKQLARQQKRPPQQPIDDLAARVILQSYLNALNDGLAPPPPRL